MAWKRRFSKSLYLNDGRMLSTLAQARDLLIDLPQIDQGMPHWATAGELLEHAASSRSGAPPIDEVGKSFSHALRIEGLL